MATAIKNNRKQKIVIIGARLNGHAGVVLDTLGELGRFEVVGFVDNNLDLQDKKIRGIPVLGTTSDLAVLKHFKRLRTRDIIRNRDVCTVA